MYFKVHVLCNMHATLLYQYHLHRSFHEIIINVMFARLQKGFFFFKSSLQGSLDIMLFCICRSRPFHTSSEQRYYSGREELSLLLLLKNNLVKTFHIGSILHLRLTPNYILFSRAAIKFENVHFVSSTETKNN